MNLIRFYVDVFALHRDGPLKVSTCSNDLLLKVLAAMVFTHDDMLAAKWRMRWDSPEIFDQTTAKSDSRFQTDPKRSQNVFLLHMADFPSSPQPDDSTQIRDDPNQSQHLLVRKQGRLVMCQLFVRYIYTYKVNSVKCVIWCMMIIQMWNRLSMHS